MARRKQSRGNCVYCGKDYTRGGLTNHLKKCGARQEAIEHADRKQTAAKPIYHLVVRDVWSGPYWLHLEMNSDAPLTELDHYLRTIWLECCGHLSQFKIGGFRYTELFEDGWQSDDEEGMDVPVLRVFDPGMEIEYEYDFGSTTPLAIRVVDVRNGQPLTSHPIALMARNQAESLVCATCGKPATWITSDGWIAAEPFCDDHINEDQGHASRIYNSPRTGVCGYSGPAEPPY